MSRIKKVSARGPIVGFFAIGVLSGLLTNMFFPQFRGQALNVAQSALFAICLLMIPLMVVLLLAQLLGNRVAVFYLSRTLYGGLWVMLLVGSSWFIGSIVVPFIRQDAAQSLMIDSQIKRQLTYVNVVYSLLIPVFAYLVWRAHREPEKILS